MRRFSTGGSLVMVSASTDLERDVVRLRQELQRYQAATWAALDSLDEAIGWLERNRRTGLARDMRRNRATILRRLGLGPQG